MHTHRSDAKQVATAHRVHALYLEFDPTRDAVPDLPAAESFGNRPWSPADAAVNWKSTYAKLAQFKTVRPDPIKTGGTNALQAAAAMPVSTALPHSVKSHPL